MAHRDDIRPEDVPPIVPMRPEEYEQSEPGASWPVWLLIFGFFAGFIADRGLRLLF